MTEAEKDAIRAQPCGRCGATPPFTDGSRCHPHRLVPSRGYVAGNVVPRCPDCHAKEPGHRAVTSAARRGGISGGHARATRLSRNELSAIGRKGARRCRELHPEQLRENGRKSKGKGNRSLGATWGWLGGKRLKEKQSPVERAAVSRKGGLARWGKKEGDPPGASTLRRWRQREREKNPLPGRES